MMDDSDKAWLLDAIAKIGEAAMDTIHSELKGIQESVQDCLGQLEQMNERLVALEVSMNDVKRHVQQLSHDGMRDKAQRDLSLRKAEKRMSALEVAINELRTRQAAYEHRDI